MFGHGKNTTALTAIASGHALVTLADQCNSTWDLYTGQIQLENFPDNEF